MFFAKGCYFFSPQSSSVINQRWRLQKYEHKQAAFARPKYVCTGCLWTKSYYVTIQMKPPRKNLHLVLYIFSMLTWVSSDSTDSLTDSLNAPSWSFSKETKFSYSNAPPWTKLRIFLSWRKGKIKKKSLKKFSSTGISLIKYIWSDAQKRKKPFVYCNLEALMEKWKCHAGQAIPARKIFVSNIVFDEGERNAICFIVALQEE